MQTLDIISVNLWQILISLANLFIIFVILKKFLYKPVEGVMQKRREEIDMQYAEAAKAEEVAEKNKKEWEDKLATADAEADRILQSATENAKMRGDKIVADAEDRADAIVRIAQNEAELERRKAAEGIKRDIVDLTGALAEKMLEREVNTNDHRALIDSFIEEIGNDNN